MIQHEMTLRPAGCMLPVADSLQVERSGAGKIIGMGLIEWMMAVMQRVISINSTMFRTIQPV